MSHWHIATGLAGYGPEGIDGFGTAMKVKGDLDMQISDELKRSYESLYDVSSGLAEEAKSANERGDDANELDLLRAYLKNDELISELQILSLNFAPTVADAPLYVDNQPLYEEHVIRLMGEKFPLDISDNTRMYVWQCEFPKECQHVTFDCQYCPRVVTRNGQGGWIDDGHKSRCADGLHAHEPTQEDIDASL